VILPPFVATYAVNIFADLHVGSCAKGGATGLESQSWNRFRTHLLSRFFMKPGVPVLDEEPTGISILRFSRGE
jgi:hypothetical protein